MQKVLKPINDFTEHYVDDMAVYSKCWETHKIHLRRYFDEIRKAGLTLNLSKCQFARDKIKFVGHVIGSGNHGPDPEKLEVVKLLSRPITKKQVRQVLGLFSYFLCYVPNFADIGKPLTDLTKKTVPKIVEWNDIHQVSFDLLKGKLCEPPILFTPDVMKPWFMHTDASGVAVAACIGQYDEHGNEKPVAYCSSKLTCTQMAWSTIEREAYAVIWALRKFEYLLFGSQITILSDHNLLKYIVYCIPKSAKLTRWALALQEYNILFKYHKGSQNVIADCLSRVGYE